MHPNEIIILTNNDIPEAVRSTIAEHILTSADREADRALEKQKLSADNLRFMWNTPLVAAIAGLVTLSATFVFERLTANDATQNTITLEEIRAELQESVSRFQQELELNTTTSLARLEAEAKEREFQYEIVRSELEKEGKTNAERAAVLLFLARAGVLNALDVEALQEMAEAQQQNPEENIIPQLSSVTSQSFFPHQVEDFRLSNVSADETEAFTRVYQISSDASIVCNSIRISPTHFATMAHCFSGLQDSSIFGLTKSTNYPIVADFDFQADSISYQEATVAGMDGIAIISASDGELQTEQGELWTPTTRDPLVGEKLFIVGYAPAEFRLQPPLTLRGLALAMSRPIIHRGCSVIAFQGNRVSTDCISSVGMSGAPIFAESDGALITLAAWGDGRLGITAGPSLTGLAPTLPLP